MKKILSIILVSSLVLALAGCGGGEKEVFPYEGTATEVAVYLQENVEGISKIVSFNEETDENGLIGEPNAYTSKADFFDPEVSTENSGTIEVFANNADATSRNEYLKKYQDPSLGVFGLKQYIFQKENILVRVSYDYGDEGSKQFEEILNGFSNLVVTEDMVSKAAEIDANSEDILNERIENGISSDYCTAVYTGHEFVDTSDGRRAVVVYYDFTNHEEEPDSAMFALTTNVFQNGVQCDKAFSYDLGTKYDGMDNYDKSVQKDTTIKVAEGFILQDDSAATFRISRSFSEKFNEIQLSAE